MAYDEQEAESATPEPRKGEGKMGDEELQTIVGQLLTHAVQYVDGELSPAREIATDYYLGKPFGNEAEGRSQVVLTEVRDAVSGTLPSMLKVIFGSEHIVEFAPKGPEDEEGAKQATDYARLVFEEDNPGFLIAHSVLKDGLVRKIGVAKWRWEDSTCKKSFSLDNVDQSQLESLMNDEDVEISLVEQSEEDDAEPSVPNVTGEPTAPTGPLFHVEGLRKLADGRMEILPLPPEEFLIDPNARAIDTATIVAHRTELTRGELIALGVDEEEIEDIGGDTRDLIDNPEAQARRQGTVATNPEAGPANDKILYCEAYVLVDVDGDGVQELRQICTIGSAYKIVSNKLVDERPFALFCPDPEPHTIVGGSLADRTMDMQLYKSSLIRSISDSAALSLFPRTAYVEGQVSVADILNTEIGAPIRMAAIGMATPFTHPFMGGELLPLLAYADEVVERRTGMNKGTMGLDADALQSSTAGAVGAAVSSAQQQTELYVRLFAEQFLKPLFRGVLRTMIAHQPRARTIRLRGKWVEVDPRNWNADMDVRVNIALGAGLVDEKLARLTSIVAKQELILTTLGPSNPIVTLAQYSTALREAAQISGFVNPDKYFNAVDPQWQPAPTPPQPSPEMALVQIEQQKAQATMQQKQVELMQAQQAQAADMDFKSRSLQQAYELETAKMQQDYALKMQEMELKYRVNLEIAQQKNTLEHERETQRMAHEQEMQRQKLAVDTELQSRDDARKTQAQGHEQQLAESSTAHGQHIAERKVDVAEQSAANRQVGKGSK